jgi:hypothetical protein
MPSTQQPAPATTRPRAWFGLPETAQRGARAEQLCSLGTGLADAAPAADAHALGADRLRCSLAVDRELGATALGDGAQKGPATDIETRRGVLPGNALGEPPRTPLVASGRRVNGTPTPRGTPPLPGTAALHPCGQGPPYPDAVGCQGRGPQPLDESAGRRHVNVINIDIDYGRARVARGDQGEWRDGNVGSNSAHR